MSYRCGSQPIAGHHIVRVLEEFRVANPDCGIRILMASYGFADDEIALFVGPRPVAHIRSRGYPAPDRERLKVRVVKDWEETIPILGAMLQHADARLNGELSFGYRGANLRAHYISEALRQRAAQEQAIDRAADRPVRGLSDSTGASGMSPT
jgi:hypothetical protein